MCLGITEYVLSWPCHQCDEGTASLCAEGNQAPGSSSLSTSVEKKVLTRSNILTPCGLTTCLGEFLFVVLLVFYECIMRSKGRGGQVEKAKMKGGVCRAVLCVPWPIGRNGQRQWGQKSCELDSAKLPAGVFPGEKRRRERSQTEAMG